MNHLDRLASNSIYFLREAHAKLPGLAMLWSFGKDSNTLIHLIRKAFFGRVPFPLIHCDTGLEMDEVYAFRDRYTKEWGIQLISIPCPALDATDPTLPPAARVASRKTLALKEALAHHGFTGIITGIRRDEEGTRAKELRVSARGVQGEWSAAEQKAEFWDQYSFAFEPGGHVRLHPLLDWTELDIWQYTARERIPLVPLYFAHDYEGRRMRFRSLGEKGITFPVPSDADTVEAIIAELKTTQTAERAGRPMGSDKDESSFERLRKAGYM